MFFNEELKSLSLLNNYKQLIFRYITKKYRTQYSVFLKLNYFKFFCYKLNPKVNVKLELLVSRVAASVKPTAYN